VAGLGTGRHRSCSDLTGLTASEHCSPVHAEGLNLMNFLDFHQACPFPGLQTLYRFYQIITQAVSSV
jgi:hypothetical protein